MHLLLVLCWQCDTMWLLFRCSKFVIIFIIKKTLFYIILLYFFLLKWMGLWILKTNIGNDRSTEKTHQLIQAAFFPVEIILINMRRRRQDGGPHLQLSFPLSTDPWVVWQGTWVMKQFLHISPDDTTNSALSVIYWSISNGLCQALRRPQTVGDTSWHHLPCGLTTRRLLACGPVAQWSSCRVVHPMALNSGGRRAKRWESV